MPLIIRCVSQYLSGVFMDIDLAVIHDFNHDIVAVFISTRSVPLGKGYLWHPYTQAQF